MSVQINCDIDFGFAQQSRYFEIASPARLGEMLNARNNPGPHLAAVIGAKGDGEAFKFCPVLLRFCWSSSDRYRLSHQTCTSLRESSENCNQHGCQDTGENDWCAQQQEAQTCSRLARD